MLTETGRVVALEGGVAWVETLRRDTCGQCAARAGCGHGLLNSTLPGASRALVRARLPDALRGEVQVQDTVQLALSEKSLLRAASLLYLLPLAAALAAALLADQFLVAAGSGQGRADLQVSVAALLGLVAGLMLLRQLAKRRSDDPTLVPLVMLRGSPPGADRSGASPGVHAGD